MLRIKVKNLRIESILSYSQRLSMSLIYSQTFIHVWIVESL